MHSQNQNIEDLRIEAARLRLQSAADQADVFEAIREIIANLFGSEEMALYRVDPERAVLWLSWSFGIDPHVYGMVDLLNEPALDLIFKGKSFVADATNGLKIASVKDPVTAFIPVRYKGQTVAVLAILRLLAQKQTIDPADAELFGMLSHEIGKALFGERGTSFLTQLLEEEL